MGQDRRPDWMVWARGVRDDPEALIGVVDDGHDFGSGGSDRPILAEEIEGVIGVKATLEMQCQVEIEQGAGGGRTQVRAFFLQGLVPSGVGS